MNNEQAEPPIIQTPLGQQSEAHPQEGAIPQPEKEKINKWLVIGLSLIALILFSIAGVFAYNSYFSKSKPEPEQKSAPQPKVTKQPTIPSPTPTIDSTTSWKTYQDSQQRFSFRYPADIPFSARNKMASPSNNQSNIEILLIVEPFKSIFNNQSNEKTFMFYNLGYGYENAEKDYESLQKGEYGNPVDFAFPDSKRIISLNNKYAKTFTVLGRFDTCDVVFERRAIFYPDSQSRAILILSAPTNKIISENPKYFAPVVGDPKGWKQCTNPSQNDGQDYGMNMFYEDINSNQVSGSAHYWYTVFDQILSTIKFTE